MLPGSLHSSFCKLFGKLSYLLNVACLSLISKLTVLCTYQMSYLYFLARFFATATSGIFELEEAKDDGDNRWYDLDLNREEREALKYIFNTLFLAIACGTMFVPMMKVWHPTKGMYDRFNMGVLTASTFLMGSMLFVTFWYSLNLGVSYT